MTNSEQVLQTAIGELGTKESPANSNNVKYNTWYYGHEVSGSDYPWCMAFVQWCFNEAGTPLPYTTASCSALLTWYKKHKSWCVVTEPARGDIVIYNFGHTGILESDLGSLISAIEGNTAIGNDSNGGEVMRRTRHKSLVKAYIRPFEEEPMTYEDFCKFAKRYDAEKAADDEAVAETATAPEWAAEEFGAAIKAGITDGTRPTAVIPRYQAALMAFRAADAAVRYLTAEDTALCQRIECHDESLEELQNKVAVLEAFRELFHVTPIAEDTVTAEPSETAETAESSDDEQNDS